MNLTPLQIEIMQLGADKTLSFGCIAQIEGITDTIIMIKAKKNGDFCIATYNGNNVNYSKEANLSYIESIIIIGHPITRGRLCYLRVSKNDTSMIRQNIDDYFFDNHKLYNQTILERPEEIQIKVRDFLLSIQ